MNLIADILTAIAFGVIAGFVAVGAFLYLLGRLILAEPLDDPPNDDGEQNWPAVVNDPGPDYDPAA